MNRKKSERAVRHWGVVAALVVVAGAAAGCQRGLFAEDDPSTEWRIKRYFDNDSARETSENRKRGGDMGFGLPMGASQQ